MLKVLLATRPNEEFVRERMTGVDGCAKGINHRPVDRTKLTDRYSTHPSLNTGQDVGATQPKDVGLADLHDISCLSQPARIHQFDSPPKPSPSCADAVTFSAGCLIWR